MKEQDELAVFISEEFDDSSWGQQPFSKMGVEDVQRLGAADRTIRKVTTNSYIRDIYTSATNLRNILGDMDAVAFEIASDIRRNLLVIAATIKKKPSRLILDTIRTYPMEEALRILEDTVKELNEVIAACKRALAAQTPDPEGDREVAASTSTRPGSTPD